MTGEPATPPFRALVRVADAAAVAAATAELVARLIAAALADRGVAHVSLAGGTTPRLTYDRLELDRWAGVELWFGDERCVGQTDPESNFRMVEESLLPHAPGALVHRIQGELGPDAAADAYDALIRDRVAPAAGGAGDGGGAGSGGDRTPVLDVNLLGIGPDGHTASLFPGNPALAVTGRAVRDTILLVSGESKAAALAGVLAGPGTGSPSSLLARDRLTLIVDDAAAADAAI
jgi:6-phosphogluconolactonase